VEGAPRCTTPLHLGNYWPPLIATLAMPVPFQTNYRVGVGCGAQAVCHPKETVLKSAP
jgi:hypothetical protein